MASRATWRGAVEVGGFPVHVALYSRVKTTKDLSFKYLSKEGGPVKQCYITKEDYDRLEEDPELEVNVLAKDSLKRGIEEAENQFFVIPEASIDAIKDAERSRLVEPDSFCVANTVPIELARAAYKVTPDDKVAGSARPYSQLWNGLRSTGLAYCTNVTTRAGSRDAVLVLYAGDDAIYGAALPFAIELNEVPTVEDLEVDDAAANMFAKFIEAAEYEITPEFDHYRFTSTALARRETAIAEAKEGKVFEAPEEPAETVSAGDLTAALEAALAEKGKAKVNA